MTDQNNISDWIDDKGYQEGSLENKEFIKTQNMWKIVFHTSTGIPVYDKMSDSCCHKTVLENCADCPFKEK